MELVTESMFRARLREVLDADQYDLFWANGVTGPGRSGAVAAVYFSHQLGIPFLPYGLPCPDALRPLLIVDTAKQSGATLRKAAAKYSDGLTITKYLFDEPPRVMFWYERGFE